MINYIKADFNRIGKRIPRYITIVAALAATAFIMLKLADGETVYGIVDILNKALPYICPIFGIIEFIFVYADDLKAKTMQIAIGRGVSRNRVVMSKWIEHALLCFADLTVLLIEIVICSAVKGAIFSGEPAADVIILMVTGLVKSIGAMGMTMILVFLTENVVLSVITYILASVGILGAIFGLILTLGPLENLHLDNYLFSNLIMTAQSRMIVGTFSVGHILGILVYLAAFYFATVLLFKRKELEF